MLSKEDCETILEEVWVNVGHAISAALREQAIKDSTRLYAWHRNKAVGPVIHPGGDRAH